jgi:hypothetical protein
MKTGFFIAALAFTGLTFGSSITINGSPTLGPATYDNLKVNGSLTFNKLKVTNWLKVNGSSLGEKLKCTNLKVNGSFNGKNVTATGVCLFIGEAFIRDSDLKDLCVIRGNATIVDTVVHGDILLKDVNDGWSFRSSGTSWSFFGSRNKNPSKQILVLKGNTVIKGDIAFGGQGEVHLYDDASIKGEVVNARVIRK